MKDFKLYNVTSDTIHLDNSNDIIINLDYNTIWLKRFVYSIVNTHMDENGCIVYNAKCYRETNKFVIEKRAIIAQYRDCITYCVETYKAIK